MKNVLQIECLIKNKYSQFLHSQWNKYDERHDSKFNFRFEFEKKKNI